MDIGVLFTQLSAMKIDFVVDHIDPLGQGVSKLGDRITFIPKTLPDEKGQASITKESKGVRFASINSPNDLTVKSPNRIISRCPHFDICPGCHFLHTDYDNELLSKKNAFYRHLKKLDPSPEIKWSIDIHRASSRTGYRNRIQLHYDKMKNQLGMIQASTKSIIPIPDCIIATDPVLHKLKELYADGSWKKLVKKGRRKGHIEIYQMDSGKVRVSVNRPYSDGGFTQVNREGNEQLLKLISERVTEKNDGNATILDLFGGKGNLSRSLSPRRSWVVDASTYSDDQFEKHQQYIQKNLFDDFAPRDLFQEIGETVETMIIDPPRSGVKNLSEFVNKFEPKEIIYVSCNPATLTRDLQAISSDYTLKVVQLHDFFPGTYHFESLCVMEKKV